MIQQYEPLIGDREKEAINQYMKDPGFITEYKNTTLFEQKIAEYLNVKECIVVNNGTISLSLALLAIGIKPGDKVIIPDLTMIATINAVIFIGAIPVLCDVNERLLLDTEKAKNIINKHDIKAVIYVSLNGRSFSLLEEDFIRWCKEKNICIIEDAAQSFGSNDVHSRKIGGSCDITSFSFSMPKIITTGQGGCLTTNNILLAEKLRRLKDFGRSSGGIDTHIDYGINSKFTELQAVLGLTQLETIEYRTAKKKHIYELYREKLRYISGISFIPTDLSYTVPWFVDIYIDNVDALLTYLLKNNIKTRKIYPPIHTQPYLKDKYNTKEEFNISSSLSSMGLWLPSSLTLEDETIKHICDIIKDFYVS